MPSNSNARTTGTHSRGRSEARLPDGDLYLSSTLTLLVDENRVLEIYLQGGFSEYSGTAWRPTEVHAFVEGPCVTSFKAAAAEGERLHAVYLQRAEDDRRRQETEELRTRFGIGDIPIDAKGVESDRSLAARFGLLVGRVFRARKR